MQTIWDLLPASLWPTQPFVLPPDPTQPQAWPQAAMPSWNPTTPSTAPLNWPLAPVASASTPVDANASVSPWDSAVRQALASQRNITQDADLADAASYDQMLADAKRAHAFAMWAFGPPSAPPVDVSSRTSPSADDGLISNVSQSRTSNAVRSATRGLLSGLAAAASASGQAAQAEMAQPIDVPSSSEAAKLLDKTSAADFLNSIPRGILKGLANTASTGGQAAQTEMGQPVDVPSGDEATDIVERNVTGALPKPQGTGGHFGETVGEFLGNPISYLGPGSLGAKLFGTIASAVGSETAGQLAKGTWLEPFARIGGAIVAGGAAGSAFNRGRAAGERAPPEESGPHDAGPRPSPSADELKYVEDAPPTVPVQLPVGPDDIAAFRARHQLPDDLDTFGVARTNIPGLEDEPFEGAAPAVRDRVGWPRMEPGEISSPSADPRGQWHAEEDLINQVHNKIKALRLRPDDLAGHELSMYLSQPPCPTCLSGFGRNPDAEVGVLKKFSTLYPKLTIHVGADTPEGPIYFTIRNGTYRTWRYP